MKISLLAVGYLISLIPPVVIVCALAGIAGLALHLVLFPPKVQAKRRPARTRRTYTNTLPQRKSGRWPVAVGCAA